MIIVLNHSCNSRHKKYPLNNVLYKYYIIFPYHPWMASHTIILCVSEIWISLTWFLWFGFRLDPILIKNKLPPKNVSLIVSQAWATSGPRATYGPPSTLMWPASYIWKCLNSYIDHKSIENINLEIRLLGHVLARGYLNCL